MCLTDRYKTIYICASGSVGGARPCQGRGRGFESRLALFLFLGFRALLLMMGNFGLQGFPFFYCNVKINYTFLLITQCFFKAFLRICEWGFRLNLLCFHSDPHITDIHRMNGLNFHLSNHFHPLFSIFSFFLYHFGRNSFISAVFTLTF